MEVEGTTMETVPFANPDARKALQAEVPVLGVASAVAFAAAGSVLGLSLGVSLLARKRWLSVPFQLGLGVLAGCAAVVTWTQRQEEIAAARQLVHHAHEVRDARWLRKNPVAYG
jgi:hypothetical protein